MNEPVWQEEMKMSEFMQAALPWVLLGVFIAVSCAVMSRKKK